jgi:HAE1 family hydrophobic/amphiphilic exporter-1
MEELKKNFPEGLEYRIPYDTTIFVRTSIDEVYVTLAQAAGLVFLVLFLFLQDWRATLIPAVAIPVSLIGTLAVMLAMGFSINMLTLFGLVLAIGVVVDDAIVVVEAVVGHMERGLPRKEAAIKAMSEVSGPVVATTLVLLAVFIPAAFMPGITGQMYQQFALTIAVATVFSSINALTMSPALASLLLRTPKKQEEKNAFFRGFDAMFRSGERGYAAVVGALVRRTALVMLLFVGLLSLTGWQFTQVPGLRDGQRAAAQRGLAGTHPGGDAQGRRHPGEHAGRQGMGDLRRLLADRQRGGVQRSDLLRHPRTLG